jgi:hypothetical protein
MKEHRAQLSNSCKIAIADRMTERRPDQSGAAPAAAAKPVSKHEDKDDSQVASWRKV